MPSKQEATIPSLFLLSMADSELARLHPQLNGLTAKELLYIGEGAAAEFGANSWALHVDETGPSFQWPKALVHFSSLRRRTYRVMVQYGFRERTSREELNHPEAAGNIAGEQPKHALYTVQGYNEHHAEQLALDQFHQDLPASVLDAIEINTIVVAMPESLKRASA